MTPLDAIAVLEGRLGYPLPRHRQLADPAHPDYSPAYAASFVAQASSAPPPAPPPPAPAPTELELLRTLPPCKWVRLCGCSNPGLECGPGGVKPGARVTREECLACLAGS